jgi:hypothetical protein
VSIPGRYSLSDRRDARGERRVFACRAVKVSPHAIALATPVNGNVGERVFAQIDHLGKLEGAVVRPLERGFVMNIVASEEERDRLAAKIEWLESYKNHDAQDQRADGRTVQANPYSKMALSDGSVETCLVLDLSVSGAAISADTVPEVERSLQLEELSVALCGTLSAALAFSSSSVRTAQFPDCV